MPLPGLDAVRGGLDLGPKGAHLLILPQKRRVYVLRRRQVFLLQIFAHMLDMGEDIGHIVRSPALKGEYAPAVLLSLSGLERQLLPIFPVLVFLPLGRHLGVGDLPEIVRLFEVLQQGLLDPLTEREFVDDILDRAVIGACHHDVVLGDAGREHADGGAVEIDRLLRPGDGML